MDPRVSFGTILQRQRGGDFVLIRFSFFNPSSAHNNNYQIEPNSPAYDNSHITGIKFLIKYLKCDRLFHVLISKFLFEIEIIKSVNK